MLQLTSSYGRPQTVAERVAGMRQEDRIALHAALVPFVKDSSTGPVSLEKIRLDFARLSKADCMEFINGIRQGVAVAEAAIAEREYLDAWAASIADAKARAEKSAKEVV